MYRSAVIPNAYKVICFIIIYDCFVVKVGMLCVFNELLLDTENNRQDWRQLSTGGMVDLFPVRLLMKASSSTPHPQKKLSEKNK